MTEERKRGFSTRAVHAPRVPEIAQQPSSVPIYHTSTWRFDTSEEYADVISFRKPGYVYGRGYGNPTVFSHGRFAETRRRSSTGQERTARAHPATATRFGCRSSCPTSSGGAGPAT